MKIGFIGLGIMGSRMAANLQKAGYDLVINNRSREKATTLIDGGATWAETPAAVAQQVELLITMLGDPTAVEALALGTDGFLPALPAGALWADCSTVNPSFSQEMATRAQPYGVRFLDAPVTGSKNQAASAELTFIVGGASDDLDEIRPLFGAMGQRIVHVGGHGMGTSLKLVLNLQLGIAMAAFAEGVALGQSMGISEELLLNVLIGSPVTAPFLAGKRDRFMTEDYTDPDFPLGLMLKDIHLATVSAYETKTGAIMAAAAKALFTLAANDSGDLDFSALFDSVVASNRRFGHRE